MIGIYDYTVILTYLSLLSASLGIFVTLDGSGHPYIGTFFLLFCGLCDAFDGFVARTKKNRSELGKKFGIQIDSLCDLVAFGVLPACIGMSLIRTSPTLIDWVGDSKDNLLLKVVIFSLFAILALYVLAALIRLAYFNVTEEERQRTEGGTRKDYTGLPVTSAALIFPIIMLFKYVGGEAHDLSFIYFPVALITGFLFLSKIRIPKPHLRGILILVGIGLVECIVMLVLFLNRRS
ncbi:MAG: phosphatidylserine synthase [Ruminococcaceae bacterium]|nr:phosphatidylserine synthase [Oscillospiraceae bacterium]